MLIPNLKPEIELQNINSSNIQKIGWLFQTNKTYTNAETSVTEKYSVGVLRIQFTSGSVYDYYNVREDIWERFQLVESKGKFFHQSILGKYEMMDRGKFCDLQ